MSLNYIAKLLRELRLKHNLTQDYLGHKLGKNQTYYSRLESGKSELTIPEAKILAKEFNVSLNKFFEEIDCEDELIEDNSAVFSEYLTKCFKEEYFKILKEYLKVCQDKGIEPNLK